MPNIPTPEQYNKGLESKKIPTPEEYLKKKEPMVSDGQESTSKVQELPQESVSNFRTVASPKDWYKETQKTKPERVAKEPVIEKFDTGVKNDEEIFEQKVAETYNTDVNPAKRIDKFNKELLGLKLKYDPLIGKDENAITEYNKEATEKAELLGLQFKDGKVGLEASEQKYWQENYTRIWDDMLKEKAKNEKDSFAKSVLNKLGSGSGKDVMLTPYRAFKASEKIWNAVVPSSMESQYWADFVNLNDDKFQEMSTDGERYEQGAIDMIKSGDISGAVGNIALDVSESLPMLTTLIVGNAAGATKSTLGYMGASKGFAEYDMLDRETELPEFVKITNALTKGLNEVVWEQWGTVKILDGVKKAVADKGRNQISKELAGAYYSKLDKAVSHLGAWGKDIKREALSEGATQLSDNIVDIASGLKPVEELFDQVGNSMLVGGVIGGGISLPAHIPTSDKSKYIRSVAKSVPEEFSTDSKIDIVKEVIKREEFDYKAKNTNNEGIKAAYEKIVKSSDQKIVDIIAKENGYEQDTEKKGSQLKQSEELAITKTDTGKEIKELTPEQKVYKEQLSKRTPEELAQLPSFGGKKFTMATIKPNGDISNVYLGGGEGASHNQYMTPEDADLYEQGRLTIGVYSKRLGEFMEAPQKGASFGNKVMKSAFSKVEEPINEKEQKTETGKVLEGETGRVQEPVKEPAKVESAVKDIPELQFLEQDLPTKKPDKNSKKDISNLKGEIFIKPIQKKVKQLDTDAALSIASSNDVMRPVMNGVYYDVENQVKVASDAMVLSVIPEKIKGKSRVIDVRGKVKGKGEEIIGKYPEYNKVIPTNVNFSDRLDINDLSNRVFGVARANDFVNEVLPVKIKYDYGEIYFDPKILDRGLSALQSTGTKEIILELPDESNRAIIIRDANNNKKFSLVMPIQSLEKAENTILDIKTNDNPEAINKAISILNDDWAVDYNTKQLEKAKKENDEFGIKYSTERLAEVIKERDEKINNLKDRLLKIGGTENAKTTGTISKTPSVEEIRNNGEQTSPEVYLGEQGNAEVPAQEIETFESAVTKGLDKGIEWLDDIDKQLSKFGKETLGVNLPVAVAQTGVKAAKIALQAGKTVSEAVDYAINEIRNTDWYKGLTDKDKIDAENKVKGVFTGETKIKPETTEPSLTGVRVESTEATREEFGIGQREKVKTLSDVELTQKADEEIKKGYNIESLIAKMEEGTLPSDLDQRIIRQYLSGLEKQFESNPNDDQLLKIKRAVDASDIAGTMLSASFRSRKGEVIRDDSLAGFFIEDMNNLGVDKLTPKQKEIIQKEWDQINDLKKKLEDKVAELEAKQAKDKAEKEFKKQRSSTKTSGKKTHEDFIYERKQILSSLAGKWKEASRDNTLSALPLPYAKQLAYITPDVARLMKSYIEEGIQSLDEMITKLHSDIKPFIPDIQEKDIHNLIAGEYKEPAKTRSELTIKLQDLRTEAKLINKYEDLEKGIEPKSERRKILRNKELADLRKRISGHDLTKLSQAKNRIKLETEKIQDDLKTGNYANEKKKTEIQLDKEGLELKDKLIQARQERTVRILKDKYANRTDLERAGDLAIEIINTSRALMTSGDMSGIFRQALIPVISHPIMAAKYFAKTFSHIKSEKAFSRWLYDVLNSPDYPIMKESGLYISNPINPELSAKEEVFMGNLAEKIPVIGKYLVKPSERAYISFLNQFRVGLFRRMAEQYLSDGKTYYNNPKLYKETAKLINNETGRGGLGKLEGVAKYLNTPIFAPRLIASRLNLITNSISPRFYLEVPKEVRVEYWKDMIKFLGTGVSVLGLAALAGADVEEDWRSTDFGKIKIGDQRWDIWGGFQTYIRLIGQLVTGETKSATTGKISKLGSGYNEKSRGEVLLHFTRGKLAPAAALSVDVFTGKTMIGENVTVGLELRKNLLPLMASDVTEALKDKGISGIFTVGVPAFFGVGVQNYPTTGARSTPIYPEWMPETDFYKYKGDKYNALGEKTNEIDYNIWSVLSTEKFNIQPKAKQELKDYNTEDGRPKKYSDEQYIKYIKARGEYIKEGISNYVTPDRDDIISTLKESDAKFKDEEQIEKVADMMILDVKAKYMKNLKQKADRAGELAATGMEGKPSKTQQMINEEEE